MCQAHVISVFNEQRISIWNIDPSFDDGCRYQHVVLTINKINQNTFHLRFCHLTVDITHARFWHQRFNHPRHLRNVFNTIMQIVRLPTTRHLTFDCTCRYATILLHHIRLNWVTIGRWRLNDRQVTHTDHRHIQSTRNWCGR